MSEFESFVAICKGYCAINILILPKNFENGGWVIGVLSINIGCCFVLYCAQKLVKCGIKINSYSFSAIARQALGSRAMAVVEITLSFCQFSFTIA